MCARICLSLYLIITLGYSSYAQASSENLDSISRMVLDIESDVMLLEESLETLIGDDPIAEYDLLTAYISSKDSLNQLLTVQNELLSEALAYNRREEARLEKEINRKSQQYATVMRIMYRKKLQSNPWLYLLSAESLEKAWIRFRRIRELEKFVRKEQTLLSNALTKKENTITTINDQLLQIQHNQNKLIRSLEELKEVQEDLSKTVEKILKDEEKARKRLAQKQKRRNISASTIERDTRDDFSINTKRPKINDEKPQNVSFADARGRMSWPVDGGVIIEKFGRRPHDIVPNVWIENNGVGIMTRKGNNVKAVHKGIVKEVPKINDKGYMIIIEHGDYLTSYFTIANTYVRKGDTVSEGQIIGTISKSSTLNPILHFEIWKGYEKVNPARWLSK